MQAASSERGAVQAAPVHTQPPASTGPSQAGSSAADVLVPQLLQQVQSLQQQVRAAESALLTAQANAEEARAIAEEELARAHVHTAAASTQTEAQAALHASEPPAAAQLAAELALPDQWGITGHSLPVQTWAMAQVLSVALRREFGLAHTQYLLDIAQVATASAGEAVLLHSTVTSPMLACVLAGSMQLGQAGAVNVGGVCVLAGNGQPTALAAHTTVLAVPVAALDASSVELVHESWEQRQLHPEPAVLATLNDEPEGGTAGMPHARALLRHLAVALGHHCTPLGVAAALDTRVTCFAWLRAMACWWGAASAALFEVDARDAPSTVLRAACSGAPMNYGQPAACSSDKQAPSGAAATARAMLADPAQKMSSLGQRVPLSGALAYCARTGAALRVSAGVSNSEYTWSAAVDCTAAPWLASAQHVLYMPIHAPLLDAAAAAGQPRRVLVGIAVIADKGAWSVGLRDAQPPPWADGDVEQGITAGVVLGAAISRALQHALQFARSPAEPTSSAPQPAAAADIGSVDSGPPDLDMDAASSSSTCHVPLVPAHHAVAPLQCSLALRGTTPGSSVVMLLMRGSLPLAPASTAELSHAAGTGQCVLQSRCRTCDIPHDASACFVLLSHAGEPVAQAIAPVYKLCPVGWVLDGRPDRAMQWGEPQATCVAELEAHGLAVRAASIATCAPVHGTLHACPAPVQYAAGAAAPLPVCKTPLADAPGWFAAAASGIGLAGSVLQPLSAAAEQVAWPPAARVGAGVPARPVPAAGPRAPQLLEASLPCVRGCTPPDPVMLAAALGLPSPTRDQLLALVRTIARPAAGPVAAAPITAPVQQLVPGLTSAQVIPACLFLWAYRGYLAAQAHALPLLCQLATRLGCVAAGSGTPSTSHSLMQWARLPGCSDSTLLLAERRSGQAASEWAAAGLLPGMPYSLHPVWVMHELLCAVACHEQLPAAALLALLDEPSTPAPVLQLLYTAVALAPANALQSLLPGLAAACHGREAVARWSWRPQPGILAQWRALAGEQPEGAGLELIPAIVTSLRAGCALPLPLPGSLLSMPLLPAPLWYRATHGMWARRADSRVSSAAPAARRGPAAADASSSDDESDDSLLTRGQRTGQSNEASQGNSPGSAAGSAARSTELSALVSSSVAEAAVDAAEVRWALLGLSPLADEPCQVARHSSMALLGAPADGEDVGHAWTTMRRADDWAWALGPSSSLPARVQLVAAKPDAASWQLTLGTHERQATVAVGLVLGEVAVAAAVRGSALACAVHAACTRAGLQVPAEVLHAVVHVHPALCCAVLPAHSTPVAELLTGRAAAPHTQLSRWLQTMAMNAATRQISNADAEDAASDVEDAELASAAEEQMGQNLFASVVLLCALVWTLRAQPLPAHLLRVAQSGHVVADIAAWADPAPGCQPCAPRTLLDQALAGQLAHALHSTSQASSRLPLARVVVARLIPDVCAAVAVSASCLGCAMPAAADISAAVARTFAHLG